MAVEAQLKKTSFKLQLQNDHLTSFAQYSQNKI